MNAKNHVGDGKMPNRYWVSQYDEKFDRTDHDKVIVPKDAVKGGLIGEYKTYREALQAVNEAYLPHVFVEDRLSGTVFETMCYVCPCCGKEDYDTFEDIRFSREQIKKAGKDFE